MQLNTKPKLNQYIRYKTVNRKEMTWNLLNVTLCSISAFIDTLTINVNYKA